MSWVKLRMKFPGTCIECKKPLKIGEMGLWSKGVGVKHMSCSVEKEIPCIICGKPAGCQLCELFENCNVQKVSPYCVCFDCSTTSLSQYKTAVAKKFPVLIAQD